MSALLEVENLNSYYGDSHILFNISLHVAKNEVVALLGRNGAGKSTTLKSLIGMVRPRSGHIVFDGVPIHGLKSHAIAAHGLQLVPEERRIFGTLSVEENLVLAGMTARYEERPTVRKALTVATTEEGGARTHVIPEGGNPCRARGRPITQSGFLPSRE